MCLKDRNVPMYLIRILAVWYSKQEYCVRWGNVYSNTFYVIIGVRQGGILSPTLFNVYMDGLSLQLRELYAGCAIGNLICNHLMYADDLVLFAPSARGLQSLIDVCVSYGEQYDIVYNAKKSNVMTVKSVPERNLMYNDFKLGQKVLSSVANVKYLGHVLDENLNDKSDIERQRRYLHILREMC